MLLASTPTCMNGSNKRLAASSLIPGPVSATENCNVTFLSSSYSPWLAASASEFAIRSFDGSLVCGTFVTETRITPLMTWRQQTRSEYAYFHSCLPQQGAVAWIQVVHDKHDCIGEKREMPSYTMEVARGLAQTQSHIATSSYGNKARWTRGVQSWFGKPLSSTLSVLNPLHGLRMPPHNLCVNLRLFPHKFVSTWRKRSASPTTQQGTQGSTSNNNCTRTEKD